MVQTTLITDTGHSTVTIRGTKAHHWHPQLRYAVTCMFTIIPLVDVPWKNLEERYAHQWNPNISYPDQHLPPASGPSPSHVGHSIPLAHVRRLYLPILCTLCLTIPVPQDIPNNGARDRPPPMSHVVDPLSRSVYESVPSGMSAAESLKRLADRYLHDPGSHVDALRVGLGPSGGRRLRVIIVLDIDI